MPQVKRHDSDGIEAIESVVYRSHDGAPVAAQLIRVDALLTALTQVEQRHDH